MPNPAGGSRNQTAVGGRNNFMARRRKRLPQQPAEVTIEKLAHDGRGIGHIEGKVVFVEGALPGETVLFHYTQIRRDYACGKVLTITHPATDRVKPRCTAFDRCGGCSLQHASHEAQIRIKQDLLLEQLRRIGRIEHFKLWPPLTGPQWGYRHKARLGVRFVRNKGRVLVGFRERASGKVAEIDHCLILHPAVGEKIRDLSILVDGLSIREQIPQIEIALGDNRHALVFRTLSPPNEEDTKKLITFGRDHDFDVYLQPKGPDSLICIHSNDPALLCYELPGNVVLWFGPLEFTQVNPSINRKMIELVLTILAPKPEESILDLFCGLGNFTLPLAKKAGMVTGVEGNPQAVERGKYNARANAIENATFHCTDLSGKLNDHPWSQTHYDKILLDPARSGALEVMEWIPRWNPKRVVYVSCNPATLARDLGILVHDHGFRLLRAGIMDMFPHTAHVESIALLER